MKQTSNVLTILSVLLLFSGCSLLDNRKQLAQKRLETQIDQESQGAIKLIGFEKTDGQERTEQGVKTYALDFKATIEYEEECYKNGGGLGGWLYSDFSVAKRPAQGWDSYLQGQGAKFQKGAQVAIIGQAEFEKKESGWNVEALQLSRADIVKN